MLPEGKIFAIGDIHGCYQQLTELISRLPLDRMHDTLVFLGDYINRGPQSREVIAYLLDLRAQHVKSVFLMGNHEHLLLSYARTGEVDMLHLLRAMGVEATLKSYGNAPIQSLLGLSFMPPAHLDFLNSLALCFRAGRYLFVHADTQNHDGEIRQPDQMLSGRGLALAGASLHDDVTVFGHTAFLTPLVAPDRIGIDTGAARGNLLTALELPHRRFYHVHNSAASRWE